MLINFPQQFIWLMVAVQRARTKHKFMNPNLWLNNYRIFQSFATLNWSANGQISQIFKQKKINWTSKKSCKLHSTFIFQIKILIDSLISCYYQWYLAYLLLKLLSWVCLTLNVLKCLLNSWITLTVQCALQGCYIFGVF